MILRISPADEQSNVVKHKHLSLLVYVTVLGIEETFTGKVIASDGLPHHPVGETRDDWDMDDFMPVSLKF